MGEIIRFPKNDRVRQFYRFLIRWSDGVEFVGDTVEECFRRQKDLFEPHVSMNEYLDLFRTRLENVNETYYDFVTIGQLVDVLVDLGYLEVVKTPTQVYSLKGIKK